jgi:hypothetical protein
MLNSVNFHFWGLLNYAILLYLRPEQIQRPVRLGVRTLDFHSRNRGSIPLRATDSILKHIKRLQIKHLQPFVLLSNRRNTHQFATKW